METRAVTLNLEGGKITGILLNSVLDSIFLKLFQNAQKGAKRHPLHVEHGVKMVVFGCFLLEANVNAEIRDALSGIGEQEMFTKALWKTLRSRNVLEKFDIISSLATRAQQERLRLLIPGLKSVFDLRNRLAHFKDEPHRHAGEATPEAVIDFIKNLPIPELNKKLMWSETKSHAAVISKANRWLYSFHRSYHKRKSIKETRQEIFSGKLPMEPFFKNG